MCVDFKIRFKMLICTLKNLKLQVGWIQGNPYLHTVARLLKAQVNEWTLKTHESHGKFPESGWPLISCSNLWRIEDTWDDIFQVVKGKTFKQEFYIEKKYLTKVKEKNVFLIARENVPQQILKGV